MPIETNDTEKRASKFAALADPSRLAIVDHLLLADASPSELRAVLGIQSNLLAHHLGVLKTAGIVRQTRSEADRRRTYLQLDHQALESLVPATGRKATRVLFVCTQNSARSQLAAAIWNRRSELPAASAGTHPASGVHPGAVAAARRHKLHLRPHTPRYLGDVLGPGDLVIAVCDNAHEELPVELPRLHWSVPDPVRTAQAEAFDAAVDDLTDRIEHLVPHLKSA
ncbi:MULTISPECIES: arsenate reductase/protein-tyrosine-phosphatase family protein [Mycolicibacterium]|jgi:protein-tyrosine-phosphatase/DNA-binding transcriptional ArsR family regulator|uniref:arsenate reductase/protein-tyrosine-phosphatase family protein n=1 Tax=Mycolicibacterium TaxID=1866885 RepID=UPI00055EBD22|nr:MULTISPECIES: helix-turn-helix domain-containing protein [Mycolicibacterium]QZY45420.1 helix-turn-helix domain-containing protein [Mycolicibacterium austroafricanum]UJL29181.1 helix-turn-helix domain-containing protein [Mycolicibacterium vanbaalenii]WND55908.1 helix-turn-helix domain-containing protein [Mycolicibacterium vanbaalenii]